MALSFLWTNLASVVTVLYVLVDTRYMSAQAAATGKRPLYPRAPPQIHDPFTACTQIGGVRFVLGTSFSGGVEYCHSARMEWIAVCGRGWSNTMSQRVCRQVIRDANQDTLYGRKQDLTTYS